MYIIIHILGLLISTCTSTKLYLTPHASLLSEVQSETQIPEIHDHPFSCELIFFNVHDNQFLVKIAQLPENVAAINLTAWTSNSTIRYNSLQSVGTDAPVVFYLDFLFMKDQKNLQIIMNFDTNYFDAYGNEILAEQRKAYILFSEVGQDYYIFRLPQNTIIITTVIGLALMLILPWNIQYRKYLPLTYNMVTCSIYIVILVVAIYLQMIFGNTDTVFTIQRVIIGVFQFICIMIYTQDILMLFISRSRLTLVFGFCFAAAIIGLDNFVGSVTDAWFLNDIIAVMIAGAVIKFVIIRKMKTAIWALALMWVFCLFREFAKQFHIQKFDQGFGIRVLPIFVQLPTYWIDDSSSLSCSAFGSSKIICFGIVLNFCKRVDLYLSSQFYRILGCILTIICVSAELIFNLAMQELPAIEVMSVLLFYPLVVGFMLFFANKRGERAEIWHGSFYDMAVNRASIQRSVSFEDLQEQFGRDLILNASVKSLQSRSQRSGKSNINVT